MDDATEEILAAATPHTTGQAPTLNTIHINATQTRTYVHSTLITDTRNDECALCVRREYVCRGPP